MPWDTDYAKGSLDGSADFLRDHICLHPKLRGKAQWVRPGRIWTEPMAREFVANNLTVFRQFAYGSIRKKGDPFPSCIDFTDAAFGQLKGTIIKMGLELPVFGPIAYLPSWVTDGIGHDALIWVLAPMQAFILEPQNGRWTPFDAEAAEVQQYRFG